MPCTFPREKAKHLSDRVSPVRCLTRLSDNTGTLIVYPFTIVVMRQMRLAATMHFLSPIYATHTAAHTHTHTHTHTNTHTHTLALTLTHNIPTQTTPTHTHPLSLSLSLKHTRIHTCMAALKVAPQVSFFSGVSGSWASLSDCFSFSEVSCASPDFAVLLLVLSALICCCWLPCPYWCCCP
jgi:hypothetical protein